MTRMQRLTRISLLVAIVAASVSCGDVVRTGRASSYLVIDSLAGIRGAATIGTPTTTLTSDVITNVTSPSPCTTDTPCPTVFGDLGQAVMHIVMKDEGSISPTTASQVNSITLSRYHVEYSRADGRNTQGVEVPYAFDGTLTVTVSTATTTFGFTLVRVQAKDEPPLVQLRTNPQTVTEFAKVTFYGSDQAGNQVTVSGNILINFGNFGDF
jgi:hypothetical protein